MRKISFFLLSLAVAISAGAEIKKLDKKYLARVAKEVWDMPLEQFNPKAELSDSIFANAPAAYIAVYQGITAKRESVHNLQGGYVPNISMMLGETRIRGIRRSMVKINSREALDKFTEFSFSPSSYSMSGPILSWERDNAFGARIHKPDGKIINVDMNNTLTETDGKKEKDARQHKIAIPSLEVGDVLEYFFVTDNYFLGNQGAAQTFEIMQEYPVANLVIRTETDSKLTTELNTFNGVEEPENLGTDADNMAIRRWTYNNVKGLKKPSYMVASRQLPMIRVNISDNISRLLPYRHSARPCGVFTNVLPQIVMEDIGKVYASSKIAPEDLDVVESIMEDYMKKNPDATPQQLADAAWMASIYYFTTTEDIFEDWDLAAFYKDLSDRMKLPLTVILAATSPRNKVDIRQIAHYDQANPLVIVGDRFYTFTPNFSIAPGEIPAGYAGEAFFSFGGKRFDLNSRPELGVGTVPASAASANTMVENLEISVPDPESSSVNFKYDVVRKGNRKDIGAVLVSLPDFQEYIESVIPIPKKLSKQKKGSADQAAEKRSELMNMLPKTDLSIENFTVDSARILTFGFEPENPVLSYKVSGKAENVLSHAGNDLLLSLAGFADLEPVADSEASEARTMSIFTAGPYNIRLNISVKIPEGYHIDPSSLKSLGSNVTNSCGAFFAQTKLNPDNNSVDISINFRNKAAVYTPSQWPDFVALRKACSEFASNSIVFQQ